MHPDKIVDLDSRRGPQTEHGYSRVANELLEAMIAFGFTAREWTLLAFLIRKTYGFQKRVDRLSVSQFARGCGLDRAAVSRTLQTLEQKSVISRTSSDGHGAMRVGINKHYRQWTPVSRTFGAYLSVHAGRCQNDNSTGQGRGLSKRQHSRRQDVVKTTTDGVVNTTTTKENTLKDKHKPPLSASQTFPPTGEGAGSSLPLFDTTAAPVPDPDGDFERFWAEYPKRKHRNRKRALKAFRALNPDSALLAQMIEAIRLWRETEDWRKENGQYIPLPETWIRAEGWLDEIVRPVYTTRQFEVMRLYNGLLAGAAEWPEAVTEPYSPSRATAIDAFLGFSASADMPERYFRHCADELKPHDGCGFDWLIRRETFLRIREGVIQRRDGSNQGPRHTPR